MSRILINSTNLPCALRPRPRPQTLSLSKSPTPRPILLPSAEDIRIACLQNRVIGKGEIIVDREVDSTMDVARRALPDCENGSVYIADTQTKGRGLFGNTWYSPPGKNLYLSVVIKYGSPLTALPLMAGVAVCEALMEACSNQLRPDLRWANDVLVGNRKISGILAECTKGRVKYDHILGIGINVNMLSQDIPAEVMRRNDVSDAFQNEFAELATSIHQETGIYHPRGPILFQLLKSLDIWLAKLENRGFDGIKPRLDELTKWMLGRPAKISRGKKEILEGKVLGIDNRGFLIFQETSSDTPLDVPSAVLRICT